MAENRRLFARGTRRLYFWKKTPIRLPILWLQRRTRGRQKLRFPGQALTLIHKPRHFFSIGERQACNPPDTSCESLFSSPSFPSLLENPVAKKYTHSIGAQVGGLTIKTPLASGSHCSNVQTLCIIKPPTPPTPKKRGVRGAPLK